MKVLAFLLPLMFIINGIFPIPAMANGCTLTAYTPTDVSGAGLTIGIDNTTGSGVNNSSYCAFGPGLVYFQFFVIMPVTSDTHQVKISLPASGPKYDMPATVGAVICPSPINALYADVTPASIVKFFINGDPSAVTYAEVSGCDILVSGIYYQQ